MYTLENPTTESVVALCDELAENFYPEYDGVDYSYLDWMDEEERAAEIKWLMGE